MDDMITCKVCGHTEMLTKKFKCSHCGAVNWGIVVPKKKNGCITEIIIGIVFIAGILGYNKYKEYHETHWSQARIEKTYANNLVPVYHEYVYELFFDDPNEEPIYFVRKEDGEFEQWKKGMQPNSVSGCGLLTGAEGTCITTRNITRPHIGSWDLIGLRRQVLIMREMFNIRSGGHYSIFTVKLGYYQPGQKMNESSAFCSCKEGDGWAEGIYQLTPINNPGQQTAITPLSVTAAPNNLLPGNVIYVMSFDMPLNTTLSPAPLIGLSAITAALRSDVGDYIFTYTVSTPIPLEGSPVISEAGKVIGFTSFDSTGKMRGVGFGMGE